MIDSPTFPSIRQTPPSPETFPAVWEPLMSGESLWELFLKPADSCRYVADQGADVVAIAQPQESESGSRWWGLLPIVCLSLGSGFDGQSFAFPPICPSL